MPRYEFRYFQEQSISLNERKMINIPELQKIRKGFRQYWFTFLKHEKTEEQYLAKKFVPLSHTRASTVTMATIFGSKMNKPSEYQG